MLTEIESRKARRKEKRSRKKRNHHTEESQDQHPPKAPAKKQKTERKNHRAGATKNERSSSSTMKDRYGHFDSETASALRREDDEIAALEAKLGLKGSKGRDRLRKEYGSEEGYGDDFGSFLDDLDGMVERAMKKENICEDNKTCGRFSEAEASRYRHLDSATASALQREDDEIEALEAKLGIRGSKGKNRLRKEFGTEEGYGDDFGTFLDDLDGVVNRVMGHATNRGVEHSDDDNNNNSTVDDLYDGESDSDELVPMKGGNESEHESLESSDDESSALEEQTATNIARSKMDEDDASEQLVTDEFSDGSSDDESDGEGEADHDFQYTYSPTKGQDIYGNKIEEEKAEASPNKYVPPHLRKKQQQTSESSESKEREESLKTIRRTLNSLLNKLSEDSVVSVAQSICRLYPSHPASDVNDCIWQNAKSACVSRTNLMVGLTPIYVAALAGVHSVRGDSSLLGGFLMETVVTELWNELGRFRHSGSVDPTVTTDAELVAKEASNLAIFLCYMYNFGIIHCTLMYDVVRDLLASFEEIDIELLLLILRHSGRALRTDDPSALKDIVLLVQKRSLEVSKATNASRVAFMVAAITDLKNNKKRNQHDTAIGEKTLKLRKAIGQAKMSGINHGFQPSTILQRVSLADILQAETKGRYWKVGASWAGNQYRFHEEGSAPSPQPTTPAESNKEHHEDTKLLKLAEKYRMNSDLRRSIFMILMASADCDESFEKLVRAEMLKNRSERETVRVLIECCANEKAFNMYYVHLAVRICEFQPQSKFSLQLAFWDTFKTLEGSTMRRTANLAKLLFHLVIIHRCLKLNVLKAIDLSAPQDLAETHAIFVTIFFSNIMEHFEDPFDVTMLFEKGLKRTKVPVRGEEEEDLDRMDEVEALCANFTVFFVKVLKKSPKNQKDSRFRANLKAAIKACDTDNFF